MRRVLLVASLAACEPARPQGDCLFWADCGEGGACEYTAQLEGVVRFDCSFTDPSCETGRRFGEFASPERAGTCVEFSADVGGICDADHPCGEGVQCSLDRCVNVADLDATGGAFAARCSSNLRLGGDVYIWGYVLGVMDAPISIGVFVDAAPLTAVNAGIIPPPSPLNSTVMSIGENHLCVAGTTETMQRYSACVGIPGNPAIGVDPDGMPQTALTTDNPFGVHSKIAAGGRHTCALRDAMTVDCWGDNADRAVDGTANNNLYVEATVDLPHRSAAIDAGQNFSCAGTAAGVYCWGGAANWADGTFEFDDGRPQLISAIPANPVTAVAAGQRHACAIVDDQLWCWGANDGGQVSGEATFGPSLPTQPLGDTPVISVAAGKLHTCAVTAEHQIMCWGANNVGQLGLTTTLVSPQVVPLEARAVGPIALSDDATCALLEDALVHCWGQPDLTTDYNPPLDRVALCLQ